MNKADLINAVAAKTEVSKKETEAVITATLDAITAGTLHPNPKSIGINALPESPILPMIPSITYATLDIYPLSSNTDRKKNSTTIIGRKERTLPTAAKIPFIISEWMTGFMP